ncbi:hypothetical protein OIU79_011610 [Salix purpurea]|uniref:Uncharacterized protein n=1 Tax=Salix purpurea TaxID=77065 RepID=A0A9Q0T1N6_SALPP|nr:hypothetical protein OIU79_011610 [Salix purpurea]
MEHSEETQGLVVAGGGERNGMEGSAVGIGTVGIEGMLESGGKVTFGTVGTVGIVCRLGSGGKVTFGTVGTVGIVGRLGSGGKVGLGSEGRVVGKVGCGRVGTEGNGGNAGLGRLGTGGKFGNCRRLRAASPPKNDKATKRAKKRHLKVGMPVMFPLPRPGHKTMSYRIKIIEK